MVMRTFLGPFSSKKKNRERKEKPSGFDLANSEPISKINPRSNIDLAVIKSPGCSYEMKMQEAQKPPAQHNYSADRKGVFNTLLLVDNRNEEGDR